MKRKIENSDNSRISKLEKDYLRALNSSGVGRLTIGLTHELNNSISVVLANIEFLEKHLKKKNPQDSKAEKYILRAEAGLQRLKTSIGYIDDLEKGLVLNLEKVGVIEVDIAINQILDIADSWFIARDIILKRELEPDLKINGVVGEFQQIILHLLANAREAIPNSGKNWIEIKSYKKNESVHIEIIDSTSVLSDQHQTEIFQAFYTGHAANSGRGLGLELARDLCEGFSGLITAEKNCEGGLVFHLELPIRKRVLYIGNSEKLPKALENLSVKVCVDLEVANACLVSKQYDEIYVEYHIGESNGLKFIAEAKSKDLAGKFILLLDVDPVNLGPESIDKFLRIVDGVLSKDQEPLKSA